MQSSLHSLATWFKGSILGTILLGALGSILAALLLKVVRWLLLEIIPDRYHALKKLIRSEPYVSGYVLGRLQAEYMVAHEVSGYFVYFSYLLARLVIGVGATVLSGSLFLFLVSLNPNRVLTYGSYAAVLTMFVSAMVAISSYRAIQIYYLQIVRPLLIDGRRSFYSDQEQAGTQKEGSGEPAVGESA